MKTDKKVVILVLLTVFLFGQGCFTLNQIGTPTNEAIEITNSENATSIKRFERTKTVNHFIYGLVSPDDAGIEKVVSDAVRQNNGTRAVNVKMKYRQTFVNGLVGALTLGIYTPFTLTIEGDVVQ